jgi:succinyl-diaminopimelate desuccinylase
MPTVDVIKITQKLVSMNSVNPPGNETPVAKFIGDLLLVNGFTIKYISYGENRMHLVAKKGPKDSVPVVLSGHLDTVPLGEQPWNFDPFSGKIKEGKVYGRGSSDMKAGIAAMIVAAIHATAQNRDASVLLLCTAGEETGCQGAKHLVGNYPDLGNAKGLIIGEPTANVPAIGHKGGLYLNVTTTGKTAHSSMPHLGDNAIYKAAAAVLKVQNFVFHEDEDPLLGFPTLNVGKFRGGLNLNSVADRAEFTIDARTTTKTIHAKLLDDLKKEMGSDVQVETLVDLNAVSTKESHSFVQLVYEACGVTTGDSNFPMSMPYLTDGALLQPAFQGVPTVILGPGQPETAHKTDEFCYVSKIEEAVKIYTDIILKGVSL